MIPAEPVNLDRLRQRPPERSITAKLAGVIKHSMMRCCSKARRFGGGVKALKYLTLLSVVVGAGLLAGTPAADAAHGGGEGRSGDPNWSDNPGYFTVEGTNRHSIVKAKKPVHYRICMHHGGGTTTVIHDGQTTPMHGGNCTDFVASNIDIEGTDADGSATGDFGPVETQGHHMPHMHRRE